MRSRWQPLLAMAVVVAGAGSIPGAWANDFAEVPQVVRDDYYVLDDEPRRRASGALERVQAEADRMLQPEVAGIWGLEATLTPSHLTNDFMTIEPNGIAGFNVLDAEGFDDGYKCNLFVFELAYRAGMRIPMIGRIRGWGYPGPNDVLRQVRRGRFYGGWAAIADHLTLDDLREAHELGGVFMVVGEGAEGRAGHMGMVDEVHQIRHDGIGRILRVTYSGWEANGDGAHYRRRTWNLGRYSAIHLIELREPRDEEPQCYPIGTGPRLPSDLDAPRYAMRIGGGLDEMEADTEMMIASSSISLPDDSTASTSESTASAAETQVARCYSFLPDDVSSSDAPLCWSDSISMAQLRPLSIPEQVAETAAATAPPEPVCYFEQFGGFTLPRAWLES